MPSRKELSQVEMERMVFINTGRYVKEFNNMARNIFGVYDIMMESDEQCRFSGNGMAHGNRIALAKLQVNQSCICYNLLRKFERFWSVHGLHSRRHAHSRSIWQYWKNEHDVCAACVTRVMIRICDDLLRLCAEDTKHDVRHVMTPEAEADLTCARNEYQAHAMLLPGEFRPQADNLLAYAHVMCTTCREELLQYGEPSYARSTRERAIATSNRNFRRFSRDRTIATGR